MVGSAFSSWLMENGWTDVDVLARRLRKRGRFSSAQFTFRGKHNDGSLACHTLVATAHDGSDCFVEITPWRPPPRTPKTTAIRQRGLAYERNASAAPPSSSAKTSNDNVILIQPSQTPSAPAPRRNNRDASASEEGARGRSRSPVPKESNEVLRQLGLSVSPVPKDGACWFHSLAFHFSKAKKSPTCPKVLRTQTADYLRDQKAIFEPHWDRADPKGQPCSSWNSYVSAMRGPAAWAGELDILAIAEKHDLRVIIVRPGDETVMVGTGRSIIWVLFRNSHYEPLAADSSATSSVARRQHVNDIAPYFRLALNSKGNVRAWKLSGGGARSVGSAHTLCAHSERSAHTLRSLPQSASARAPSCGDRRSAGAVRSSGPSSALPAVLSALSVALAHTSRAPSFESACTLRPKSGGVPKVQLGPRQQINTNGGKSYDAISLSSPTMRRTVSPLVARNGGAACTLRSAAGSADSSHAITSALGRSCFRCFSCASQACSHAA